MRHVRHRRVRSFANSMRSAIPRRFEVPARYWAMRALNVHEREISQLADWVAPGAIVADVGANFGPYTYALARLGSTVHAFEPNPDCADALRAWPAANVLVHEVALSDTEGDATLTIPLPNGTEQSTQGSIEKGATGRTVKVESRTLDHYDFARLDFMKVDVEGHELAVIRGGRETLRRCRPIILVEIAGRVLSDGVSVADVVSAIHDAGYSGVLLTENGEVPANEFDAGVHQLVQDGERMPGYANMFLFRPVA
jgi:FkbM family methyltransferase